MAYNEADAVNRIWFLLRDYGTTNAEQLLNDTEIVTIGVRGAEQFYSRIRPREVVEDGDGDGTSYLALPTAFEDGLSSLLSIEHPVGSVPPDILDPRDYQIERTPDAQRVIFLADAPEVGTGNIRLRYTAGRALAVESKDSTILDSDFIAFCDLGASICADAIAAKYARTNEPAINADVVNYRSRAMEWRDIAKRLWERWEAGMGIGGGQGQGGGTAPAADAYANWDASASWGGYRFNHPRGGR